MTTINIQFTLFSAFYSPLIATMSAGFLKEEGLDYEWSVSPPGVSAVEAVLDGSADVIQSAPSQAFNALKTGQASPVLHFAKVNEMDGFFITSREVDSDFSWHKLEGAEVVMFGAGQPNAMFRYACHKAGIDYDKIKAITPGGPDAIDKAYRQGQGQYVQQQGPYPQQLAFEEKGNIVAQVGPLIGACAFSSLAASREWLQTDEAKAFTRAYAKARLYLNETSAKEVAANLSSFFSDINQAALESCISTYQQLGCWTPDVEITREAFDVTLDVFEYSGGLSERYAYDQVCCAPPGIDTD